MKTKKNIKSPPNKCGKKITLAVCTTLCFYVQIICAQTIPSNFFGINHWMPGQIPVGSGYPNGRADCPNVQTLVANAGVKLVRIGGGTSTDGYDKFGTDWNGTSASDNCYIAAIEAVGVNNADFLIQVPFSSGITPSQAGTMVQRLFDEYPDKVFYYAIGNEWDHYIKPGTSPARGYYASEIAALIKDYADDMKAIDPTIKIVAPALTYYGAYDGNTPAAQIMPILLSGNGSASDITVKVPGQSYYYVDVVDFHTYAGGNYGDMSGILGNYNTYRAASIAYPSGGFTTDLNSLQTLLSNANTNNRTSPSSPLTYAVTELNIAYKNPPLSSPTFPDENQNTPEGLGARSFFAGQYWVDMFSAILKNGTPSANTKASFVNVWSIHETSGDGSTFDLSMTKGAMSSCSDPAPQPLSTYWHYQMMAENFTGAFFGNQATSQTNYKALACSTTTEIRVLIMNQNEQSPRGSDNSTNSIKINFNSGTTPSGYDMLFAFNMGNSTISGGGCSGGYYCCSIQKETSMYLAFNKSTGALIRRETYGLKDALRTTDTGTETIITSSTEYNSYNSSDVHSNIIIGAGGSINATSNETFKATNSIQLNGPFSSGSQTLSLQIDQTCP